MKAYVGSKIIQGRPADNPKTGEEGYEVVYPDGYRSWSPRRVFEGAYREVTADERRLIDEASTG